MVPLILFWIDFPSYCSYSFNWSFIHCMHANVEFNSYDSYYRLKFWIYIFWIFKSKFILDYKKLGTIVQYAATTTENCNSACSVGKLLTPELKNSLLSVLLCPTSGWVILPSKLLNRKCQVQFTVKLAVLAIWSFLWFSLKFT